MAKLEVRFSDGGIETKPLSRDRSFLIGSSEQADLRLTAAGIEPKHATIRWVDRRYRLEVAPHIKNVFVGVNPVQQLRLKPDAEFSILNIDFRVRYDADELGSLLAGSAENNAPSQAPSLYLSKAFLGILAGLIVLGILSVGLYFLVRERTANRQFEQATKDLQDKLYADSLAGFDRFIVGFADDPRVDQAIYLRGKARVLSFVEAGGSSLEPALAAAEQWIAEAGQTKEFAEHPVEIGDIILSIARPLAEQSRDRANPAPLALSEKTLELLSKALPAEKRPTDEIARVQALQEEARLAVAKGATFEKTLADLDKSLADQAPATTYELYRQLVHRYPDLRSDRRLRERLQKGANLERELVRFDANLPPRSPTPEAWRDTPAWTLVRRLPPTGDAGSITLAVAGDVLYGVDVANGQVRWRTVMGFPSFFRPTPLPSDPSSAIAYREESHSVVLLDMLTGQERDRLNLGSARPAVGVDLQFVENQAWVVCSPSTDQPANLVAMIRIEEDRLSLVGSMVFPQAIASAPEFDPERRSMLAVARESTLYSVSLDRRQIEHVFPLGHEAGSIRLRPVLAGRFLFIVERKGVDSSVLRTFILQKKDGSLTESTGLPIDGELDDAPIVRGGRLFWASDRGERKAFELGSENDAQPLTLAATASDPEADPNTPARLLSISESEFWVLTRAAKKYRLVVERKELSPTGSWPLVGPARRESRVEAGKLVAIAQDESLGGIVIQGLNDGEPQPRWSTQLGSQAGTLVAVEGPPSSLLADWGGNVVTVSPEEISAGALVDKPFDLDARRRANPVLPISPLGAERALGLSATGRTLRRVLPDGAVRSFSLSTELTGQVARLGTGLLVPSPTGYAYWVSLDDGSELADPFAAPFRQGSATPLQACRSIDPDQPNAGAWAAGGSLIFRLEWGSGSTKLWQEKFRIELPEGTDTQEIHPAGELLWVVTPNALFVIDTQTKAILGSAEISLVRGTSRIVGEKLVGIDGEGQFVAVGLDEAKKPKLSWRSSLTIQPLPRWDLDAGRIVAALTNGELVGWNSADGTYESIGKVACSLRDGPIRLADTWVGVASDGSLVSWPKQP